MCPFSTSAAPCQLVEHDLFHASKRLRPLVDCGTVSIMTIAEARRLVGARSNYHLAQILACDKSLVSRWKRKGGNRVPSHWAKRIREMVK